MNYKLLFYITVFLIIAWIFILYGRSIYIPFVNKFKKKETVDSIIKKIGGDVYERLEYNLQIAGYKMDYPHKIIIAAFKEEKELHIYSDDFNGVKLIKKYPFTGYSGTLGPKLKEGDKQIPEGIYNIDHLNPNSAFYLSLKVNYPNEFDKSKTTLSTIQEMGGDVFIHGKSSTVGCIPVGDEAIEEIFVLAHKAFNNEIKVIISPRDFRKNPEYPSLENIEWETELYDLISKELKYLPKL